MDIRAVTAEDGDRIRRIAEQSFQTSYSLSPDQIETIVEAVFAKDRHTERIEDDSTEMFVATVGEEPIGFVDLEFGDRTMLRWLHVEPGQRGQGIGTALFEHAVTAAEEHDSSLVGRTLVENDEGDQFCEQFGFERAERTKLEFTDETLFAYLYAKPGELVADADDGSREIPRTVSADGMMVIVDREDETPGTSGAFYRTYREESDESYGYYCTSCGSIEVGSDSLGRLECQNCGNKHLADNWDAAYF